MAPEEFQPEYGSEVHKFRSFINSDSIKGQGLSSNEEEHLFMPHTRLRQYFRHGNQARTLLSEIYSPNNPDIEPNEILGDCNEKRGDANELDNFTRIFAILVLIGKGQFIGYFARYNLRDKQLPFLDKPAHFPSLPHNSTFFDAFSHQQWRFCAHEFRKTPIHREIERNCILPVVEKIKIGEGGTANLFRIKLHPNYDKINPLPKVLKHENFYALKTYRSKYAKNYHDAEVNAFRHLQASGALSDRFIGFYGSFRQGDTYNIILEYADFGTLENYLQDITPPSSGDEIVHFWQSILGLLEALYNIHVIPEDNSQPSQQAPIFKRWHQDIKPTNILVIKGTTSSPYDYQFKLADLGLSHFRTEAGLHQDSIDKDTGGTREYGSPECYRGANFMERCDRSVGQYVDVWSLGCVLSEVAEWVVHGKAGLERYREHRRRETLAIHGHRDIGSFHDGEKVLSCVLSTHKGIFDDIRLCDRVTQSVIKKMIEEMFYPNRPGALFRPTALQLWFKAQTILKDPNDLEVQGQETELMTSENQQNMRGPMTTERLPHPAPEVDQPTLRMLSQTSRTQTMPTEMLSLPDTRSRSSFTDQGELQPTEQSPPLSPTRLPSGEYNNPTHPTSVHFQRRPNTATNSNGFYQDLVTDAPSNMLEITTASCEQPPSTGRPADPCFDHAAQSPYGRDSQSTANSGLESSHGPIRDLVVTHSLPPRTPTKLPHLSVAEGIEWILNKKQDQSGAVLPDESYVKKLGKRDHIFLVDDAESMKPHWPQVNSIIRLLAYLLKEWDKNGMDLYFINSEKPYNEKHSTNLVKHLRGKRLEGVSDISERLGPILREYENELHRHSPRQQRGKRLSLLDKVTRKSFKPLNIYVLTDAMWQPTCDVAQHIASLVNTLVEQGYQRTQVGIQFIYFGDYQPGIEILKRLDSGLGLSFDIVDMEPATGNVWKMLVGAVNKWFDDDYPNDSPNHGTA